MKTLANSHWALLLLVSTLALLARERSSRAQNPNEHVIKPSPNKLDPDSILDANGKPKKDSKIWVLDFKFKPLRTLKVKVPGRGERICYYLWYQVSNQSDKPHFFIPNFSLVLHDTKQGAVEYRDEILPSVQTAISRVEDPTGIHKIKNSVTIYKPPSPPQKPDAVTKWITGVAIWTDPEPLATDDAETRKEKESMPKISSSNYFSIFISGLSSGLAETDHPTKKDKDGKPESVVRVKTLRISFKRKGDGALRRDEDVQYISHKWTYRASDLDPEVLKAFDKKSAPPKP